MRSLALFLVALMFSNNLSAVPSQKRLAVVDAEFEFVSSSEKQDILFSLRSMIARNSNLAVISPAEIESSLSLKNNLAEEVERVRQEHEKKRGEIQSLLDEGERLYLASEFEQALPLLDSALSSLNAACLVMNAELPLSILRLLAASYFFNGNESQAKIYLASILDLEPEALLDPQKYPPNLIDLFNSVKNDPRFAWTDLQFEGNSAGITGQFMGRPLVLGSSNGKISLQLPIRHPLWGSRAVVLMKDSFAPLVFALDKPPQTLEFASLKDKRLPTKGLFKPIGSQTAPVELQRILSVLKPQVVFLGAGEHQESGAWSLQGQWLEVPSMRASPVIQVEDKDRENASEKLVSELMDYLDASANVLLNRGVLEGEREEVSSLETPFYKKWWFWTSLGVLAAGAGLGSYFLLQQDDSLKVKIGPAQ